MKINLLGLILILAIASCVPRPKVTIDENKTKVAEPKKVDPYQLILGKWKMQSFQVFSPEPDPRESKEIIWEFKDNYEMTVMSAGGKSANMNTGKYRMNKSIINIDGQLYMYYFENPIDVHHMGEIKAFGEELWLDTNIDPSISNDGPKIYFTRIP